MDPQPVTTQPIIPDQLPASWTSPAGHFTLTKRELFLLGATMLMIISAIARVPVPFFNVSHVLLLTIFTFLGKGFFPAVKDTPLYFALLAGIVMTLYYPIFQVLLIYFLLIGFMKVLKVL